MEVKTTIDIEAIMKEMGITGPEAPATKKYLRKLLTENPGMSKSLVYNNAAAFSDGFLSK